MTVSVKVLHVLLLHSRNSCLCPDITSTKNIPRKHDRLSKISTLHSSRTALENIRILELNHLFSSGCEADSFEILLLWLNTELCRIFHRQEIPPHRHSMCCLMLIGVLFHGGIRINRTELGFSTSRHERVIPAWLGGQPSSQRLEEKERNLEPLGEMRKASGPARSSRGHGARATCGRRSQKTTR